MYSDSKTRLKRQAKLFRKWSPWPLSLNEAQDLIAYTWDFDGWGEFVAVGKHTHPELDDRIQRLSQASLDDKQRETRIAAVGQLSDSIKSNNPLVDVLYPEYASMLVDAMYGIKKPHLVLQKTDMGDWILSKPAYMAKVQEEFYEACDLGTPALFEVCLDILEEVPDFLDALTQISCIHTERDDHNAALEYSQKGYEICLQAMGTNFDMMNNLVNWGFLNNRPFHRALYQHALCLEEHGKQKEAKRLLRGLLFMNPNDNIGVRFHPLITQNAEREASKKLKHYQETEIQALADRNNISVEEMRLLREEEIYYH